MRFFKRRRAAIEEALANFTYDVAAPSIKQMAADRYWDLVMAQYAAWQEERIDLEMRDGLSAENHPSHSEWQRSDDEGIRILQDMARFLKQTR